MGTVSLVPEWLQGPGCGVLKGMDSGSVIRPVAICLDRLSRSLKRLLKFMCCREADHLI